MAEWFRDDSFFRQSMKNTGLKKKKGWKRGMVCFKQLTNCSYYVKFNKWPGKFTGLVVPSAEVAEWQTRYVQGVVSSRA